MFKRRESSPPSTDDFPTLQLFLLSIVRIAEPIALTSIFPYAWTLVKRFQVGSEEDASFYAGILISSFALAEALMGMYWGGLSDRIGRKPVLLIGCTGTLFSMVMVGFATNIWIALIGRVLGGLLNGNIGVIQTMVGELVHKPEQEPRAYSVMPFVWSVGTIIGPTIGGVFADPHEGFPGTFGADSIFATFPYLLPNLICAFILVISITLGYFYLQESHPDMQPRVMLPNDSFVSEQTPLLETMDAFKQPVVQIPTETYGAIQVKPSKKQTDSYNIFTKRIVSLMVAMSIFTYHAMTYDHLLPIFLEDDRVQVVSNALGTSFNPFYSPGGMGFSMQAVGMVMAVNGLLALIVQVVIFPWAAAKLGVWRLFMLATILHPVAYLVMPTLLYVPDSLLYPVLYLFLFIRNIFSIIIYPLFLILIKEATPSPTVLGRVNGFSASAAAACRMIAPPVAGYLYTIGSRSDCTGLAWYGSAIAAVIGAIQAFFLTRERNEVAPEESAPISKLPIVTVASVDSDDDE